MASPGAITPEKVKKHNGKAQERFGGWTGTVPSVNMDAMQCVENSVISRAGKMSIANKNKLVFPGNYCWIFLYQSSAEKC